MSQSHATTRLLLARHGEVHERWRGTIYGRLDVELSPLGERQSRRMADRLTGESIDLVVSSGLQRAEAAAAHVRAQRPGLDRIDDGRFLEMDRGDWAGRSLVEVQASDPEEFLAWQRRRGAIQAPGGEAPAAVALRTLPAFADWARRGQGGTVLIVAHLWVVRSAIAHVLGLPMARSPQIGWPPGGVCELDWPVDSDVDPGSRERPRLVRLGV